MRWAKRSPAGDRGQGAAADVVRESPQDLRVDGLPGSAHAPFDDGQETWTRFPSR